MGFNSGFKGLSLFHRNHDSSVVILTGIGA